MNIKLRDRERDHNLVLYWRRGNCDVELWDDEDKTLLDSLLLASIPADEFCRKVGRLIEKMQRKEGR